VVVPAAWCGHLQGLEMEAWLCMHSVSTGLFRVLCVHGVAACHLGLQWGVGVLAGPGIHRGRLLSGAVRVWQVVAVLGSSAWFTCRQCLLSAVVRLWLLRVRLGVQADVYWLFRCQEVGLRAEHVCCRVLLPPAGGPHLATSLCATWSDMCPCMNASPSTL
jgi:hypothetical protein